MDTFASVNQLRQSRVGQWLGCVMVGSQNERDNATWKMGHGKCSWAIEDRKCNSTPSKTGMHLVMTMLCAVKDSWSGWQVWWCPSTLNTKLVQWQKLVAKQDTGKNHGHQNKRSMEHDVVQYWLSKRVCIVGVMLVYAHSLHPIKLLFRSRPRLPR